MKRLGVLAVVVLLAVVAGCSSDDGSASTASSSGAVPLTTGVDEPDRTAVEPDGTAVDVTEVPGVEVLTAAFGPGFDPVTSPEPTEVVLADGGSAWVVDTGPVDGLPVLFVGGTGTSATVVRLVEFLSSARDALGIRLVSIDRNGFGAADLDPIAGYDTYADTALAVMDALDVDDFSVVAISGGGPYAAAVASMAPQRIRSVHLAAAYTGDPIAGSLEQVCSMPEDARAMVAAGAAADPVMWWPFPADAPVQRIPGFVEAAVQDAVRTFHFGAGQGDPAALEVEFALFCEANTADVSAVMAPVFLYYGDEDTTVPGQYADQWSTRLPGVVVDRRFPAVAHDVTYRHWGQVLVDIASPTERRDLYCMDGRTLVVDVSADGTDVAEPPEGAVRDVCAWEQ